MKRIEKVIHEVKELAGLEIVNKSFDGIPLFDLPIHQPFKFDIEISFNSIRGESSFELHFPSLYIKSYDVKGFAEEINKVSNIIIALNSALKEDFNNDLVKV